MNTQFDMFFIIVIITAAVFMVYSFSKKIKGKGNKDAQTLEIPVKVIEKRVQIRHRNKHHSKNVFKIMFEDLDTQERHTFVISEATYDQIIENDIGYLRYQRKRFQAFQRDELAQYFEDSEHKSASTNKQLKIEE